MNVAFLNCTVVASLLAAALVASPAFAQDAFKSTRASPRTEYWQERLLTIERELQAKGQLAPVRVLFLGDSITDFWLLSESPWQKGQQYGRPLWDESFGVHAGGNRALNMGISGDRIEHLLHRILPKKQGGLGHLDAAALDPEFIVVLIGINNSWMSEEPVVDSIVEGVRVLLGAIHAQKPGARIILQTLLPTAEADRNTHIVQPVNRRLGALAALPSFANHVRLLDLHAAFVDQHGKQIASYFIDGLHPNREGYRAWRDALVKFLSKERQRK